ncbi:MAG: VapC toxin family PIN domain ribonuclease, partial [Mesorhizobium sp.]
MSLILDASIAAAWLLPEEHSQAAEALVGGLGGRCPVPSLFWHEIRS